MKNTMKIVFYTITLTVLLWLNIADATISVGTVNTGLEGSANSADVTIQTYINNFLKFLYLVAVIIALWGGFNILTAAGDEEKVKKGKTILIQAAIGLFVIFLASSLVNFLLTKILAGA